MHVPPDALVYSFLKAARKDGVAVVTVYGYVKNGKPHTRMVANTDEPALRACLSMLNKIDDTMLEAAGRAMYARVHISRWRRFVGWLLRRPPVKVTWEELSVDELNRIKQTARSMLEAARAVWTPHSLTEGPVIVSPDGKPTGEKPC